jgi:hypothetical protein
MSRASKNDKNSRATSQRDQPYRALRRLAVLRQVAEGERLREPCWLDVNEMALREASARLEAQGIIKRADRTGYFIPVLAGAATCTRSCASACCRKGARSSRSPKSPARQAERRSMIAPGGEGI